MTITSDTMVGEVVKRNFNTASLFQANHIDYCCGGKQSISEACRVAGIEPARLIEQLEKVSERTDPDTEYINNLALDELCDYIVKRHHAYVRKNIPFLKESLNKICKVHGANHPELFQIQEWFEESAGELTMHMQKEELVLFPFIQKLATAKIKGIQIERPAFGSVTNPIAMMLSEHEAEGNRFDKIAGISSGYSVPADACTTYKVTLNQLKDFEDDLHRHIHLENNLLFPKAIELEKEVSR